MIWIKNALGRSLRTAFRNILSTLPAGALQAGFPA